MAQLLSLPPDALEHILGLCPEPDRLVGVSWGLSVRSSLGGWPTDPLT